MEYKDSLEPQDIQDLKTRINNELKRRNKYGSVASFAGKDWEFISEPKQGEEYTQDHLKKIIEPLLQIADFQIDNSIPQVAPDIQQLYDASNFVDKLTKETQTGSSSSCRGACTGLCVGSCSGTCDGCTGTCKSSCQGCTNTCGGSCSGCTGCGSGCVSSCQGCTGCGSCDSGATKSL